MKQAEIDAIRERNFVVLAWRRTEEPPDAETLSAMGKAPIDLLDLTHHIKEQDALIAGLRQELAEQEADKLRLLLKKAKPPAIHFAGIPCGKGSFYPLLPTTARREEVTCLHCQKTRAYLTPPQPGAPGEQQGAQEGGSNG